MIFLFWFSDPTYIFRLAEQFGVLHLDHGISPTWDGGTCRHPHHLTRHHGVGGLHRQQWDNFTTKVPPRLPGEHLQILNVLMCSEEIVSFDGLREPMKKPHLATVWGKAPEANGFIDIHSTRCEGVFLWVRKSNRVWMSTWVQTCSPACDSPMMKRSPGPSAARGKRRVRGRKKQSRACVCVRA